MDGSVSPWLVLVVVALGAAMAFAAGLGVPRPVPRGRAGTVVRWGHAVVWVLLAGTFLAVALGADQLAAPIGIAALVTYLLYLRTLMLARRS